jgi:hypothetical protein
VLTQQLQELSTESAQEDKINTKDRKNEKKQVKTEQNTYSNKLKERLPSEGK